MSASPSRKRSNDGSISPPPSKRPLKQASTTTKQAVASFFTPASQKAKLTEKVSWQIIESTLIVGKYNASTDKEPPVQGGKRKVAAFDFDSTLISTVSKSAFARSAEDWCWWHGSVPAKLKQLYEEGYTVIIVSNQGGISLNPSLKAAIKAPKVVKVDRFTTFKQKATAVFTALNLPITLYAATGKDKFRKPSTGMWEQFLLDHSLRFEDIDHDHSIFVGDAGGRIEGTLNGKVVKKDFSCSDRNLVENIGINFKTPEEYFLGETPRPFVRFTPLDYLEASDQATFIFNKSESTEVLLFVGFPGSGKSTFFLNILQPLEYQRVNQDTLKTREKCIKVAAEHLSQGKSVAVDNTNPDREVRRVWIDLAKKYNVPIRCIHFTASKELAKHNASVRAGYPGMNPESRERLPELAFNGFNSRYQEPKLDEGLSEIIPIDFKFRGSDEDRAMWSKYWY